MNWTSVTFTNDKTICLNMLRFLYETNEGFFAKANLAKKVVFIEKGKKRTCFKPVGYFDANNWESFVFQEFQEKDIYITKNGMKNVGTWKQEFLFTLHNIVIDIDCHNKSFSPELIKNASQIVYDLLIEEWCVPNVLVFTGRGIQLWYSIQPLSYKFLSFYEEMTEQLIQSIHKILDRAKNDYKQKSILFSLEKHKIYEVLCNFAVDEGATRNASGLVRFPGSYNTKSKSYGSFSFQHDKKIDVLEALRHLETTFIDNTNKVTSIQEGVWKKEKNKKLLNTKNALCLEKTEDDSKTSNLLHKREKMLYTLLTLRGQNLEREGYRDYMLHILASSYIMAGKTQEQTLVAVKRLNVAFPSPMKWEEVVGYMTTTLEKGYKYKNTTIIKLLRITKEEQELLHFYETSSKKLYYEQRKEEKKKRNEKILFLSKKGYTQSEIAEKVHTSQSTVSRVLKNVNSCFVNVANENKEEKNSERNDSKHLNNTKNFKNDFDVVVRKLTENKYINQRYMHSYKRIFFLIQQIGVFDYRKNEFVQCITDKMVWYIRNKEIPDELSKFM